MDSQLLTMFRKAASVQGGAGFALRFTGLSLVCAVLFGVLLTPLAKKRAAEASTREATLDSQDNSIVHSGGELHMAIAGDGYFQILMGAQIMYTRAGNFVADENGSIGLPTADGVRLIDPCITIPQNTESVSISSRGLVTAKEKGTSKVTQLGIVQLVRFPNPQFLQPYGENLLESNKSSGQQIVSDPGIHGFGTIRQGCLEKGIKLETTNVAEGGRSEVH